MSKSIEMPSEGGVETDILQWLNEIGWETYGEEEDRGYGATVLDEQYDRDLSEIIYWDILKEKIIELNDKMNEKEANQFLNSLKRDLSSEDLITANETFTNFLRSGKKYTYNDGNTGYVTLVNLNPNQTDANRWIAANQFQVRREKEIRPDIVCFVNGIPLVISELKSTTRGKTYQDGINDLRSYQKNVPRLFIPALFNVAADDSTLRYGSINAPHEHYNPWRDDDLEFGNDLKEAVFALLRKDILADLLDRYVFYEGATGDDIKIVPRHMQYYATEEILTRVESSNKDSGLIWHTQGSGKSYTMVFAAWNLLERGFLDNPQVLLVVDTDKLRTQMENTLSHIDFPRFEVAKSMDHLQELLMEGSSKLILSTIHMFEDVDAEVQTNNQTVVFVDEAHRYMEKDLGISLRAAIPDAQHFGFTGTPVREQERDTFDNYSPEGEETLHQYSIEDGIKDGVVLPVHFNVKQQEWEIDKTSLDVEFDESFDTYNIEKKKKIIRQHVTRSTLAELRPRVEKVVLDIIDHYERKLEPNGWKGMVVTPTRRAAALYGDELRKLRDPEDIEVLVTSRGDDQKLIQKFHTTKQKRESIVQRFKNPDEYENDPKILVVCDMLLTGFDAPILKTIYLDRNLKNHNLLQAIARTNRPDDGKVNGEIVDYAGVFASGNIEDALQYDAETRSRAAQDIDKLLDKFEDLLTETMEIFEEIDKVDSQEAVNDSVALAKENSAQFEDNCTRLEDMYESIAPDKRLKTRDLRHKYEWLINIHRAYKRRRRDPDPEGDFGEKTQKIIEDNVEPGEIKDETPIYKLEIGTEHLERTRDLEPRAKAAEISHATQEHLQGRQTTNPRYQRISQRVQQLVNDWQSGDLEPPEVAEKLEEAEKEAISVEQQQDELGMSETEHAVYSVFTDEYDVKADEATAITNDIIKRFEQIETDFDKWHISDKKQKEIYQMVVRTLVIEHDRKDLYHQEGLTEDIVEYIIRNEQPKTSNPTNINN
jgi:type I restriction enzyme R subunit